MGFLFFELILFLAAAFLLGLLIGYWIWAGKNEAVFQLEQDLATANKALQDCQSARQRLEREESAARTKLNDANTRITALEEALAKAKEAPEPAPEPATPAPDPAPAPQPMGLMSNVSAPTQEAKDQLSKSPFLDKPVGVPDDLLLIKGIGPKLGALLHSLGVFHFFQIAQWSETDIAKVDDELATFKGRIARDQWVDQAKLLAAGDHEGFTAKYGTMGENRK